MRHKPVESSLILSIGYDVDKSVLEIHFTNGTLYQYFMVPPQIHDRFMSAQSKGRFFLDEVAERFPARRVGD